MYLPAIIDQVNSCINRLQQIDHELLYLKVLPGMQAISARLSALIRGVIGDLAQVSQDIDLKELDLTVFFGMTDEEREKYRHTMSTMKKTLPVLCLAGRI